jgi:hypothetical protein
MDMPMPNHNSDELEELYAKLDEALARLDHIEKSLEELKVALGFPARPGDQEK